MQNASGMMKVGSGVSAVNPTGTGISGALNKEAGSNLPSLPINLRPGSVIRVPMAKFTYVGPPLLKVAVGVAWKPSTGLPLPGSGTDFNNGNSIAKDDAGNLFRGMSLVFFTNPDANQPFTQGLGTTNAPKLVVPEKREYNLVGGGTGKFIEKIDTWIWMVNITALEAEIGRALTLTDLAQNNILTNEKFIMQIDDDADVVDII